VCISAVCRMNSLTTSFVVNLTMPTQEQIALW
jgi:hypothetical protein